MAWCLSHLLYFRIQASSFYSKEGLAQASAQVANSCSLNKESLSPWLQALCVSLCENASCCLRQVPRQSCLQKAT